MHPTRPPPQDVLVPSTISMSRRALEGQFEVEEMVTMPDLGIVSKRMAYIGDSALRDLLQQTSISPTVKIASRNKINRVKEPLRPEGNVAEMQTVEDPICSGRVQEPNMEILIETTRAPRCRVINA